MRTGIKDQRYMDDKRRLTEDGQCTTECLTPEGVSYSNQGLA
jgi:hypothetical protein